MPCGNAPQSPLQAPTSTAHPHLHLPYLDNILMAIVLGNRRGVVMGWFIQEKSHSRQGSSDSILAGAIFPKVVFALEFLNVFQGLAI